jgi:hypothetical protein
MEHCNCCYYSLNDFGISMCFPMVQITFFSIQVCLVHDKVCCWKLMSNNKK